MSSQGFSRGPVCGVDNCPSRLWRRVDGQKVCQYGHVNTADLEINDDDDQMASAMQSGVTRRLTNIAGMSQNKTAETYISQKLMDDEANYGKIYGIELRKFVLEGLQYILNLQCEWLIANIGVPKILKRHVKELWIKYLLLNNVEKQLETTESVPNYTTLPQLKTLVTIIYLACLRLRLPIYIMDFIAWTSTGSLPFQKSYTFLPMSTRERFPNATSLMFESAPEFYYESSKLLDLFGEEERQRVSSKPYNYFPLLVRLTLRMKLPLEVIALVKNILEQTELDLSFREARYTGKHRINVKGEMHPEFRIAGILQACSKIFFRKNTKMYSKWVFLLHTYRNDMDAKFDRGDLLRFIQNETSVESISNWDDVSTNTYLDWVAENHLPLIDKSTDTVMTEQKKLSFKRLDDIFKLDNMIDNDTNTAGRNTENIKLQLVGIYNQLYDDSDNDDQDAYQVNSNEFHTELEDIFFDYYSAAFDISVREFRMIIAWSDKCCSLVENLMEAGDENDQQ